MTLSEKGESINEISKNNWEITNGNLSSEQSEQSYQKENLTKPRKGKQKIRIRILNYLDTLDEPLTSADISFNLNLDRRKTTSQLNILVKQNKIKVKRPLKHLGESFPSLYWRW
jgi:hypothetical protein